jgi:hypothetical protein
MANYRSYWKQRQREAYAALGERGFSANTLKTKVRALARYKSQMDVMGWFLKWFARCNEWFSRQARPNCMLPVRRSPCDDF